MSLLNASQPLQPRRTPPTISSSPHSNAVASPDPLPPQPILWNNPKSIDAGSVGEFFDVGPSLRVPMEEANRYLDLYRSQYSPKFPFVPIANCLSAIELYKRQPFLFQVIMQIVAPQSPSVQREVDRWVREYIARSVIVDQERRLDLIQGLLLFVAWSVLSWVCIRCFVVLTRSAHSGETSTSTSIHGGQTYFSLPLVL